MFEKLKTSLFLVVALHSAVTTTSNDCNKKIIVLPLMQGDICDNDYCDALVSQFVEACATWVTNKR